MDFRREVVNLILLGALVWLASSRNGKRIKHEGSLSLDKHEFEILEVPRGSLYLDLWIGSLESQSGI